jgi:hypothetical protein
VQNKQAFNCPTSFGVTMTNIASVVIFPIIVLFSAYLFISQSGEATGGNRKNVATAGASHNQGFNWKNWNLAN